MGVCPTKMPRTLIAPLVSIVVSDMEPTDNLIWSSLATLCEIGEPLNCYHSSWSLCLALHTVYIYMRHNLKNFIHAFIQVYSTHG